MNEDWLSLDGPDDEEREELTEIGRLAALGKLLVPRALAAAGELSAEVKKNEDLLQQTWANLSTRQQMALHVLKQNRFNIRASARALKGTPDQVGKTTIENWVNGNEEFALVFRLLKAMARESILDRDALVIRANRIAEEALEPKPILYQGFATGYFENQPDVALRANEQLLKVGGHLNSDENKTRVTVRLVNLAGSEMPEELAAIDVELDE